MRKLIFVLLSAALAALVIARATLPEPSVPAVAATPRYGYNILPIDLPIVPETAGSALIAEMNGYYLFRTPTAKHALTGILNGKNLILICADGYIPDDDAVSRLSGGVCFEAAYLPDWYQDEEGRDFAILSGLMPTNVYGESSLVHAGAQNIYLPYALPRALASEGYDCYAFLPDDALRSSFGALGFSHVQAQGDPLAPLRSADRPCFVYCRPGGDPANELSALIDALEADGLTESTAVCVYTAAPEELRAELYLYGAGLDTRTCTAVCSDLDLTPTLLDLFGVPFDSRFLSGRDIFAPNTDRSVPGDTTPLVSLAGSAYAAWVTDAGSYDAVQKLFVPVGEAVFDDASAAEYVRSVNSLIYDRYVFARRIMENNYFELVPGAS